MNTRRVLLVLGLIAVLGAAVVGYQQITETQRLERAYSAASASVDRQDWSAAVAGFEDVVRARAGYRDANARLGEARRELDHQVRYQAAMERYRAAGWADAVAQFQALLADAPAYRDAPARLSDAQRQLGFQQQLEAAQERLTARDFENALRLLDVVARSDAAAAPDAQRVLARAQLDYARTLVEQATVSERDHRWAEVEQLARLALQHDPQVAGGYRVLGHALSRLNRQADARAALNKAVASDPKDASAFNFLGWAELNGRGDLQRAESAFQQALSIDARLANALSGLGHVQITRGNTQAQATFERALTIDPKEGPAYQGLGILALGSDNTDAENQFRRAVEVQPDEAVLHLCLASALRLQQKFDAAREEIDRARELAPEDGDVDAELGRLYRAQRDWDLAIAAYDAAIARDPSEPSYHVSRGYALLDSKRFEEALAAGARAIDLGDAANGHLVRAYAYALQGQYAKARDEVRQALDADPDNPQAQQLLSQLT